MEIHSQWRDADVAGLVPAARDALSDPKHIDSKKLGEALHHSLDSIYTKAGAILESDDFRAFQANHDPKALARVFEPLEQTMLDVRRVGTFVQISGLHYADQAKEIQKSLAVVGQKLQGIAGFIHRGFTNIIAYVASIDDEKIQEMMAESAELKKFKPIIEKYKKSPAPDLAKTKALNTDEYYKACSIFEQSSNIFNGIEDRKKMFAEGLSGIIKYNHDAAVAMGFYDTLGQFAFQNEIPQALMDNFAAAAQQCLRKMAGNLADIQKFAEEQLPIIMYSEHENGIKAPSYDWKTAKDIVCSAYAKLDPALGELARRAFDEGWILAKEYCVENIFALAGAPVSQSPGSHPFAAVNFNGDVFGVSMLGHEMAHVLSNYIAGQKQGIYTHEASMAIQESFSQFAEALLEDEMLKRANTPFEKVFVRMIFAVREAEVLTCISFTKFEEELYGLISKKRGSATYEELNALYKKHNSLIENLSGKKCELCDVAMVWNMVNQPPHTTAVYPITKIMAAALHEAYEKDPVEFRRRYHEMMEGGGTIGITKLWDTLIGKSPAEQKMFIDSRLLQLEAKIEALKKEIAALPVIAKPEAETVSVDTKWRDKNKNGENANYTLSMRWHG